MDRRTGLAIALMLMVLLLPAILFPPAPRPSSERAVGDTARPGAARPDTAPPVVPRPPPRAAPLAPVAEAVPQRLVTVESPLYRFTFSTRGARLAGAVLGQYRTFAPGDTGVAQILPEDSRFLEYGLVVAGDTLWLGDWQFEPSDTALSVTRAGTTLEMTGRSGPLEVRLRYTFRPDHYLFDIRGAVSGIGPSGLALVALGPRLALVEADSADDFRSYGVVTKAGKTEILKFSSLDPGEREELVGPFEWVALKSKYFVAAALAIEEGEPRFGGAVAVGGPRSGRNAVQTDVVASLPAPGGQFRHSMYVGPQEWRRLARIGHDLEDVNPYGWVFRPIIRPFANLIVRILLWMHETLSLGYGWVLILFGLAVRLLLWPLNQRAMRSSMAMQAIQPEIRALQERHKQDPQRLQQEMMKLYREHKVNPLGGCLPMLLPMPVLFALFFVFRETIEFRGVPFLWLPDLSRHDPLYIIPIVMGISMFAVMRIGQTGMQANPQTKMMSYIMPPVLTFVFLRLSAGLNLYYAVSNIASVPQQWLIAHERKQRAGSSRPKPG